MSKIGLLRVKEQPDDLQWQIGERQQRSFEHILVGKEKLQKLSASLTERKRPCELIEWQ